jgi:hypothetical protein
LRVWQELAEELAAGDVGVAGRAAVAVQPVVQVDGGGLVQPEPVQVELFEQHHRAADEQQADLLLVVARSPAAGLVVDVAAGGVLVVGGAATAPSGMPSASTTTERLPPYLARSTGLGPAVWPPQGVLVT